MPDIEATVFLAAQHIAAEGAVSFVVESRQQLMIDPAPVDVAVERQLHHLRAALRVAGRVGLTRQRAGVGVERGGARLMVAIGVARKAVVEMRRPAVVEDAIGSQRQGILIAARGVETLVEALFARRVHRLAGFGIDHRAAIERHQVLHMLPGDAQGSALAKPHQRRRNHRLARAAEITPVIGLVVIDD